MLLFNKSLIFLLVTSSWGGFAWANQDGPVELAFTREECDIIRECILPDVAPLDPTNRVELNPIALGLGRRLFFDKRLSRNRRLSCSTCHDPERGWSDGLPIPTGPAAGERKTPSLLNVAYQRWFFWDGRADSLWSQALQPLENPTEMGSDRIAIARLISTDSAYANDYAAIFGSPPSFGKRWNGPVHGRPKRLPSDTEDVLSRQWYRLSAADQEAISRLFANVGKSLAAFERTLVTGRSNFDDFAELLKADQPASASYLSVSAQRGLKLFIGKGGCRNCHHGPVFSDGEFHSTRVPPRRGIRPDAGRYDGISKLLLNPFNSRGPYSDNPSAGSVRLELLEISGQNWGQFKTPALRNVALRSHYMHQGQFSTLFEVVRFYSTLKDAADIGHHDEDVIQPLQLSEREIFDLVAFLRSLTEKTKADLTAQVSVPRLQVLTSTRYRELLHKRPMLALEHQNRRILQ